MALVVDNDKNGRPIVELPSGKIINKQTGKDLTSTYKTTVQNPVNENQNPTYVNQTVKQETNNNDVWREELTSRLESILGDLKSGYTDIANSLRERGYRSAESAQALALRQYNKKYGTQNNSPFAGATGQGLSNLADIYYNTAKQKEAVDENADNVLYNGIEDLNNKKYNMYLSYLGL